MIELTTVGYSPDGSLLAIGGNGGLNVYSVSGMPSWSPATRVLNCTSSAFSPDGKTLAIAGSLTGSTYAVELWSVGSHKLLYSLPVSSDDSISIAFSPDGSTLIVGGSTEIGKSKTPTGVLEEWNVETGALIANLKTSETIVSCVAYSPDSKTLAVGGFSSTSEYVEIWNVAKRTILKKLAPESMANICSVAFSPDGKTLACGGGTGGTLGGPFLQLWTVSSGVLEKSLKTQIGTAVTSVEFSPDGTKLADSARSGVAGSDRGRGRGVHGKDDAENCRRDSYRAQRVAARHR